MWTQLLTVTNAPSQPRRGGKAIGMRPAPVPAAPPQTMVKIWTLVFSLAVVMVFGLNPLSAAQRFGE
jgi:hypothetical protein